MDYGWARVDEGRTSVLVIHPDGIPAGLQLFIYLPYATTDPAHLHRTGGRPDEEPPTCMPSKVFVNPLAGLYPTAPKR